MKTAKQRMISMLLVILLSGNMAACGKTSEAEEDTNTVAETTLEETTETEEPVISGPAKTDLGGYEMRVATSYWENFHKILYTEEMTGEAINDALYNANAAVMHDYNCGISLVMLGDHFAQVTSAIANAVKAGSDEYDLSYNHDCNTVNNAIAGYHLDIRSSDVFNFDGPWWTETAERFTVDGRMYFASNYVSYSPLYLGMVLCYNKDLAENYGIEIPYEDIFAGNWYMEDMISMVQNTNVDLNGDGTMTLGEDQFGFVINDLGMVNFQVSLGGSVLGKDENGFLQLSLNEERLYTMVETFEKLMEFGIDTTDDGARTEYGLRYFSEGQALFDYVQIVRIPLQLHDTDVRYGTIPVPKLDETQENYISGAYDVYWAIPKTAFNQRDTVAVILEAMGHHCYYEVLPVVYETVLQVRFSDSPLDAKTYEIIRDSMVVDAGYAYNEQNKGLGDLARILHRSESGSLASFIAGVKTTSETGVEKINETYRKMAAEG